VRNARGFTLIELLIVLAILAVVLSAAMIGFRAARVRGTEAAAVMALREINQAQFVYRQTCGRNNYAPTLVSLATPPPGSDVGFLSPDLTQADPLQKSGYLIQMSGTAMLDVEPTCTGVAPVSGYRLTADPLAPGISGIRYFGTNGDRVIYADTVSYADNMPETGAPGHGGEIK
jgi:prepilin-type N-terminal cleavage/methylation domain-containing protein